MQIDYFLSTQNRQLPFKVRPSQLAIKIWFQSQTDAGLAKS